MRPVILYIAMSLDGYIADPGGGVGWMTGQTGAGEDDGAYEAFVDTVDTVVMGWNTYHQITSELSPGQWPYEGLASYVLTHRAPPPAPGIRFVQEDPCALVRRLREGPGKGIWVCGGAAVAQPLMQDGLIDRYHLSVIPTLLGGGIPLFGALPRQQPLRLLSAQSRDGILALVYQPR